MRIAFLIGRACALTFLAAACNGQSTDRAGSKVNDSIDNQANMLESSADNMVEAAADATQNVIDTMESTGDAASASTANTPARATGRK